MELYRPRHLWQGDPNDDDPHGWYDCGSASMAMLTDAISHGTVTPTIHEYRTLVPNEPEPDPKDPGVDNGQLLAAGARFGLRVSSKVRPWLDYERDIAALRATSIATWYPLLGPWRSQMTGEFGHQLFVMAKSSDGKSMLMFDPLAKAPRWTPIKVLQAAALEWGRRTGVAGKIRYLVSLDQIPYK